MALVLALASILQRDMPQLKLAIQVQPKAGQACTPLNLNTKLNRQSRCTSILQMSIVESLLMPAAANQLATLDSAMVIQLRTWPLLLS